jgi:hypothetical protein
MILSIDIGLRNLSLCVMSSDQKTNIQSYKIHLWGVYNILDTDDYKCKSIQKNGKVCDKKCLYKYKTNENNQNENNQNENNQNENDNENVKYCCKTHFPKEMLPMKKNNHFKKKAVNDYLLQDIAKIIIYKLDEIYTKHKDTFIQIKSIIIELQPKMARKMIFVSHIIYGKLVELFIDTLTTIRFVRASQKLKAYTGPDIECKLKGSYAKRKWLSIQYTKWFLENKMEGVEKERWLDHFLQHGKKDDMSDCYLMCINGLYGIPKKSILNSF